MGRARNQGPGSWLSKAGQRRAAQAQANRTKGVPIPGTGRWHWHRRPSGSNRSGVLTHGNMEWGSTNRKQEDAQRNLNNTARRQHLVEQMADTSYEDGYVDWLDDMDDLDYNLRTDSGWVSVGGTWVEDDPHFDIWYDDDHDDPYFDASYDEHDFDYESSYDDYRFDYEIEED